MAIRIPVIFDSDASSLGSDLSGAAKSATKRVGGLLATGLKRGAQVAGAGMVAILGTSFVKGFNRLNAIDQAEAKLRGLGKTTGEIESLMKSATAAVTGTAFGLDQAAGAAGILSGAGVGLGEMEGVLRLVGDAAAISGRDLSEMGAIFGKVAATGKLSGEVLAQLLESQIGLLPGLAKEYGVTAAEASKMVSEGKVDFETFQRVMQNTVGGAAEEMGKTFSGSLANVGAALGRLGATAIGPIFERLPGLLNQIQGGLDSLSPYVEAASKQLGDLISTLFESVDWAGLAGAIANVGRSIGAAFSTGGAMSGLQTIIGSLSEFRSLVAQVATDVINGLSSIDFSGFAKEVVGAIGPLASALSSTGKEIVGFIQGILPEVMNVAGMLVDALGPALASIADSISGKLLPAIDKVIPVLLPIAKTLLRTFGPPLAKAITGLGKVISGVVGVIAGAIDLVVSLLTGDWSGAWDAAKGIVESVVKVITGIVQTLLGSTLVTIFKTFISFISTAWKAVWNGLSAVVSTVFNAVLGVISTLLGQIRNVISTTLNGYRTIFVSVFNAIRSAVAAVLSGIRKVITNQFSAYRAIISTVLGAVRKVVTTGFNAVRNGISSALSTIRNTVSSVFTTIRSTISGRISDIVGLVRGIPGKILGVAGRFLQAGKDLAGKVWDGLKAGFSAGTSFLSGILDSIKNGINRILGLPRKIGKGPLSFTIPAFANGTPYAPGGLAVVGERGPEVVDLPRGSKVYTAAQSRAMARTPAPSALGATPAPVTINQNYFGPTTSGGRLREMDWTIRYATKGPGITSDGMAVA